MLEMMQFLTRSSYEINMNPLNLIFGTRYIKWGLTENHRKINKTMENVRETWKKIIDWMRKSWKDDGSGPWQNYLELYIQTQEEDKESQITDDEIVEQMITFFVAGIDTSSALIQMILYNLALYPETQFKLEEEINNIYTSKTGRLTTDRLNTMRYLNAIVKESQRFYSPTKSLFLREATEDHLLGDIKVKKGTLVSPAFEAVDFNPKHYDEPDKFKPERWIDESGDASNSTPQFHFSGGARNCIGQHLSLLYVRIIVAEIVLKYSLKLHPEYHLKMIKRLIHEPKEDVLFVLERKT
jgi:cytochrome P450